MILFYFLTFSTIYQKRDGGEIIEGSQRLLKPNGFIIVILDSFEGKAYELVDLITENKTRVDTLEFGNLYYAEDIEELLTKKGIKYFSQEFSTNIFIPEDGFEMSNFARVLAFLYRTFPEKILASHKDDVEKFMKRTKQANRYVLEDKAKIIVIDNN